MNPQGRHPASVFALFASFWRHRQLIWQMTKREIIGRYRGSVLGLAWSFFNPILMLVIYTFVFSVAFNARWGLDGGESKADFAIVLFVGMIVHGMFAECINRAPSLILSNVNYVKKVVFPLEVLPWIALGSALFHTLISVIVLIAAQLILNQDISWTILLFPLVIFPLILTAIGFAWFLSSLGVYVRDVGQTVGFLTTMLLFLAPVFYPVSALPEAYQPWLLLNPLTFIIEQCRAVLIWGELPSWHGLALYTVIAFTISWLGFWWFQRTRKGFADVL